MSRVAEDVPETVKKQTYRGNTLARSTVVSEKMAWENIYMVEVRGRSILQVLADVQALPECQEWSV
jgi:hypothetical protein